MHFLENVALAPYTTFGIGGPARWFCEATSEAELLEAVAFARDRNLALFVLGGGSNLLVADEGFPGLVVHIVLRGISEQAGGDYRVLTSAAGEDWDGLVSYAVERGLAGIECLAGIPGTVGGTPVQNVGAYGQEVSQTIILVRALDLQQNEFVDLPASACEFSYRHSLFNTTSRGRYVVTRVDYRLVSGGTPTVSYADLKRYFADRQTIPGLGEVADAVRGIRRQKGMLLVDGDPDCRSAGSFFKNPVVHDEVFRQIAASASGPVPHFPAGPGRVKIPAAWLLENAGFVKGYALGHAGISSRHTLALINRGGATAAEIIALRDRVVAEVKVRFGIELEPEPVLVG